MAIAMHCTPAAVLAESDEMLATVLAALEDIAAEVEADK